jgi:hypothetical protein
MSARWRTYLIGTVSLCAAVVLAASSLAAPDKSPNKLAAPIAARPLKIVSLSAEPSSIMLFGPRSEGRIVVSGKDARGSLVDLTGTAEYSSDNPKVVAVGPDHVLRPVANGSAVIAARCQGQVAKVQVEVRKLGQPAPIEFTREVVPVLTRAGCNQGSCHGSQYGKGGFKLSLAGFEPDVDYYAIVKQSGGRRALLTDPKKSLFLQKPCLGLAHQGGARLQVGSPDYELLVNWLQAGAPGPTPNDPSATRLEVYPSKSVLSRGQQQSLVVVASYSDGIKRDVTRWARIGTLNDAVAGASPEGIVKAVGPGETAIMVRFGGLATVSDVSVPFAQNVRIAGFAPANYVDELVQKKWATLGIPPAPLCDDGTFIRRVYLDVIGTPPAPDDVRAFIADTAADKRAKLVDKVLERPEYADYWTLKWGDLLRSNRGPLGPKGMWSLTNWIRAQFRDNRPMDQFSRDLVTAQGSTFTNGPANFYRVASNPPDLAETTAQVFLGMRLQCVKCHHHPFEKWSQEDYYRFAAFFSRVGLKGSEEFGIFGGEQVVRLNKGGEVYHPKSGKLMKPAPLGGFPVSMRVRDVKTSDLIDPEPDAAGDRRKLLAEWISKDNPLFARNLANRYWGYLMGRGLVEPIDDQRITNPPTNPELLDALAKDFVEHKYDVKHLIRTICNSKVYQLSSEADKRNQADTTFYSHYTVKRLPAEVMLDAVNLATGTQEKFDGLPLGTRAIQLPDPAVNSAFLDTFGRAPRVIACECERAAEPNMTQALHLMMSDLVNRKVQDGNNVISKLLTAKKTDAEIVESLYLGTLGRLPKPAEASKAAKTISDFVDRPGYLPSKPIFFIQPVALPREQVEKDKDRRAVLEDMLWALLNSKEFVFNN